eukprot:1328539-Amorphochlora_amoeboformis.AAC.1
MKGVMRQFNQEISKNVPTPPRSGTTRYYPSLTEYYRQGNLRVISRISSYLGHTRQMSMCLRQIE